MAYSSIIDPSEKVITASNQSLYVSESYHHSNEGFGLVPRNFEAEPFGSIAPVLSLSVYTWDQIDEAIEYNEQNKCRLSDILRAKGFWSTNQSRTNYCWMHGCVNAMTAYRIMRNFPRCDLSAASAAAPAQNFRNAGGYGGQALKWLSTNGVAEVQYWPQNAIDRRYYNDEMKDNAKRHIVTDWEEVDTNDLRPLFTCLLMGLPCPVAFNWWGHLVMGVDPVKFGPGKYGLRILNSHNDDNFVVLEGSRAKPDDCQVVRGVSSAYAVAS